ncbi:MAG: hypothetical protein H7Y37_13950 [Anaerolineae bacterium]|nr:hypothetical protein [Gloeobacterales cyanobacterium ES-bin-313]
MGTIFNFLRFAGKNLQIPQMLVISVILWIPSLPALAGDYDKQFYDKQFYDKKFYDKQYYDKKFYDKQFYDKQYYDNQYYNQRRP